MLDKVSPQFMADEHLLPAALLEMGDSLNFIEVRKHTLRREIKDSKLSAAAGKFSGLGAIVGGAALAALSNPLGWLVGGCGLTAYTLSVFGQWLQTGKVHPMPLSSKSQDERDEDLAGQTVSGDGGNLTGRTAIHEDAAYLSDREKTEYELLHFAPQGLMSAMNNVPPAQRWACYQFLVDAFAAGTIGDYANPQTLKDVLGNPSVYSSHLPEASKRFPQYGLPSVETPQSQSESLPAVTDSGPVMTSSPIGNQTKFGAIEVPSSPIAQSAPSLNMNSGSKGFDWHRLNTDYNDFPHLFLLGKTGAGKSYVSDRLVRFLNGYCIVISPKKMPTDFQGLQVVGLPYDYHSIHRALVALEKLMVEREAEMQRTGFTDFQPINVILDELPVSSSGCKDLDLDLLKPLKTLIRAGRTSKIRLIILAQGSEVKALGIEGEGGLRDSLTYVYLKGFVEDYAAKSKIDISQVDRPCIIDGQIADTSFLAQFIDTYRAGLDVTGQAARTKDALYHKLAGDIPGTAEHLEKLFKLPDAEEGEATDDETAIEQSGTVIEISSDLGNYIKSRPDVTLWNVSSIKRANKKFRRHDDATLTKAFQILALSDRGEWDGESFKPV